MQNLQTPHDFNKMIYTYVKVLIISTEVQNVGLMEGQLLLATATSTAGNDSSYGA